MKARYPDSDGIVVRDGGEIRYERYGQGRPAILLLPTWSLVHSRHWKMQVPYLARHFTVVCFDGRSSGGSGRPAGASAYSDVAFASDALAVMDAAGIESAVLVSLSRGALWSLRLCAEHPDRVLGSVFIAPSLRLAPGHAERDHYEERFGEQLDTDAGWAKLNMHYWRRDYRGFIEFFFANVFTEPHSTKQIEDAVGWGLESDAETLIATVLGPGLAESATRAITDRLRCPVLVIHGEDDRVRPVAVGEALAAATDAEFMRMPAVGHCPQARKPVAVNLALREFVERVVTGPQKKEVVHGHS